MTESETQFSNIIKIITKYQNQPASLVRKHFSEENIMSLLFSNSFNVTEYISYILKYEHTNVYNNFSDNIKYYDYDYNIITNSAPIANENIINIDMSYYCSQNINKYFFLLDLISEIYRFRSKKNTYSGNITIRTRYVMNDDKEWTQDNSSEIHMFNIKYKYDTIDGASSYFIENKMYSEMCRVFQVDILKHLNYLNKIDIANGNSEYLTNIYLFYVFCRLKLILYTLMCCNEVNGSIQKFIDEKLAYCFINFKNDIVTNNANNKSIFLTQKFINVTDKLNTIRNNVDKNNNSIKRLNTSSSVVKKTYDDSKTILYICLMICVCFMVLTFIIYTIDSGAKKSIFSKPFLIIYISLIYIIFSFIIYGRGMNNVEHFDSMQNASGINWNMYRMIQTDLTLYPREPMSDFKKTYIDKTVVQCKASSHLTLGPRSAYNAFNRHKNTWPPCYVSGANYNSKDGFSNPEILKSFYFNNDTNYYGDYIIIDLGEKILLKKYLLHAIKDNNCGFGQNCFAYGPSFFRLYATNDDQSYDMPKSGKWTLIDEQKNINYDTFPHYHEFKPTISTTYRYYALIVNSLVFGGPGNRCVVLSEWELFGIPEKLVEKSKGKGEHLGSGIISNTADIKTTQYSIMDYMGYFYTKDYSGDFTFYINSDKDSLLWIGNNIVIDNKGFDGIRERSGTIKLEARTYYPFNARINNPSIASIHFSHSSIPKTANGNGFYFPYYVDGLQWVRKTGYQKYDDGMVIEKGVDVIIENKFANAGELYNVEYNGWFYTRKYEGDFEFFTTSDDESFLWIGNTMVVNNGGDHIPLTKSGIINLKVDTYYPIKIRYGNNRGPGSLSVYFKHSGMAQSSNGNGYFYNTNQYDIWYDDKMIEYEAAKDKLKHNLEMADEAAKKAADELQRKADLEKQYMEELKQLNDELELKKQENKNLQDEIKKNEQAIIEKDIELKRLWLKLASEEKERARINVEVLKQKAMKDAQLLTEQQLQDDLESYRKLSQKIQDLRINLETNKDSYADSINKDKLELKRATLEKDEEDAKLLAARIKELSLKNLIQDEELINRKASAQLEEFIRSSELAKKATADAIKEKERLDQLGLELTSTDVQYVVAEITKNKALQRKAEQVLLDQEAKIKAKVATDIAYARRQHYTKIQTQLDSIILEYESNEIEIDKINIEISNLDDKLKTLTNDLGNNKKQGLVDEELQKKLIEKKEAEMRRDVLNVAKDIDDLKRQIDINIRDTINERNAIIDTNKKLKEITMKIFKENYELEQYKYISNELSINTSSRDIKTKIFFNIDNIVLMIANSLVSTGLDKELKDMLEIDRLSQNASQKGKGSMDILRRDAKIMDATTQLILNLFVLAILMFVTKDVLSNSLIYIFFGILCIISFVYYIYKVIIIVNTNSAKKYWNKPSENILLNSA